jgi:hypothetical protein
MPLQTIAIQKYYKSEHIVTSNSHLTLFLFSKLFYVLYGRILKMIMLTLNFMMHETS